jgi:[ribosomal protein S18]-alanine N-acetyltransferase
MSVLSRLLTRSDGDEPDVVSIEPFQMRHLREVMPIEQDAYPKPWSRSVFESELRQVDSGSRHYIVARDRSRRRRVVGYAGLWFVQEPDGDQAHVTNIVVAPDARRLGVGTRLMSSLARTAIERGCAAWTLEVRASNTAAQDLYRKFGFAPAGLRKRYYENTEDAIVMWCHDIQGEEYAERLRTIASGGHSGDHSGGAT